VKAGSSDVLSAKIKLADSVHLSTHPDMPSLHPDPGFEYYFKACRKGDSEAKAVTVNESAVRAIADASEITGLPRDNFEIHEISKEEFEALCSR
jgi:hypothetical protein